MNAPVLGQHMGALHGYEQVLVYLLAFGPFVVLGIVVYVVRGRDVAEEDRTAEDPAGDPPGRTRD